MKKIIEKAGILIEALPYIQMFKGKITVVKFGGSMMDDHSWVEKILTDIVFLYTVGIRPLIVHGGGDKISDAMKKMGKKPRFVQGFRVTDEETIETVEKVLFEDINASLVEMIEQIGGKAMGLSGKRHNIIMAKKHRLNPPFDNEDLGFVGDVQAVYPQAITSVLNQNIIPVIAPVAFGEDGHTYNINADIAAGEIARSIGTEKLVFITDVAGILTDPSDESSLMSHLNTNSVQELIDKGVISGGMIPKVTAGLRAVQSGVHKTHIIDGRLPHSLLLEIFTDKGIGTEIVQK
ncbi:MAG: acetylglutamate kinase [Candidatus Auribacterota bacterium]|nr:acetylglutamate kinase [Candidatus Auribacterota bacterium]